MALLPYKLAKVADLIPYANNARVHNEAQVSQIAASVREFGFTNPVLVDGKKNIVAGHGRVLAAVKLGMDEVPVIELKHLTAAQRRAYVIADNKLTLNGSWNDELLAAEMGQLQDQGFDLHLLGFEDAELRVLFGNDDPPTDPEAEWQGMPEFDQQDKTAFRSIVVHFRNQTDVNAFAKLLKQTVTDKTKFLWYPFIERETYADKRYTSES